MNQPKARSGIAIHGATVALTPARAVTSHLRRHYHKRYAGRYRYAKIVFGFDLLLAGIALGLVAFNVFLAFPPATPSAGVGLVFSAPPIVTAQPIAFQADVSGRDNRSHADVRLFWNLPAGTEVLSAMPPLDATGAAYLGTVAPGQSASARVVVRLFVPQGAVHLGFRAVDRTGNWGGSETRPVVGSGLELKPLIRPDVLVSGALIPFRLRNATNQTIETVEVSADGSATAEGKPRVTIGPLAPYAERLLLVDPKAESNVRVTASAHAVPLHAEALAVSSQPGGFGSVGLGASTPGQDTFVTVRADVASSLFVYHPALLEAKDGIRSFDVAAGQQHIRLPLDPAYTKPVDRWFAALYQSRGDQIVLGQLAEGVATTPFTLESAARYFATTGDQIGIGPLPPKVGEETKYWVSWKIGPTTADLSGLVVRAPLAPGVRLTGREALPAGGTLTQEGNDLVWKLDFVPSGGESVTANFEIGFTPTAAMRGKPASLLGTASSSATENRSGSTLSSSSSALDSSLPEDTKAAGKGIVQ